MPATAVILPSNPETLGVDIERDTQLVVSRLANLAIRSTSDLEQAVLDRQDLATREKAVKAFFEPFKKMAYTLWKGLCERENTILTPILALDGRLKRSITDYSAEQDRLRRLEEQRQSEERRRQDQDRLAAEAAALEASGDHEFAAAVIEQAISAPAPVVVLPALKTQVEGLKFRTEWKWRYINDDRARAEELMPRTMMSSDEKKIGAYTRAMKGSGKIPGIEFYSEQVPVR